MSCDGRPKVHDLYRVTPGGQGSSAVVTRRIREFLEAGAADEYYVRGTFTRDNLDFTNDVLYLAGLGAKSISLEPVVAPEQMPYALKEDDIPELQVEYYRLARALCELDRKGCGVDFYHYNLDLTGGPCAAKRLTGCGAGYHYLAVTPGGNSTPVINWWVTESICWVMLSRALPYLNCRKNFGRHMFSAKKSAPPAGHAFYAVVGAMPRP